MKNMASVFNNLPLNLKPLFLNTSNIPTTSKLFRGSVRYFSNFEHPGPKYTAVTPKINSRNYGSYCGSSNPPRGAFGKFHGLFCSPVPVRSYYSYSHEPFHPLKRVPKWQTAEEAVEIVKSGEEKHYENGGY